MSNDQPAAVAASSTKSRRLLLWVGLPCAGLALFGAGLLVGKGDQPPSNPASAACAQAVAAAHGFSEQISAATPQFGTYGRDYWLAGESMANVILQNRQCFSPVDRANAQTVLDNARSHLSSQ